MKLISIKLINGRGCHFNRTCSLILQLQWTGAMRHNTTSEEVVKNKLVATTYSEISLCNEFFAVVKKSNYCALSVGIVPRVHEFQSFPGAELVHGTFPADLHLAWAGQRGSYRICCVASIENEQKAAVSITHTIIHQ